METKETPQEETPQEYTPGYELGDVVLLPARVVHAKHYPTGSIYRLQIPAVTTLSVSNQQIETAQLLKSDPAPAAGKGKGK